MPSEFYYVLKRQRPQSRWAGDTCCSALHSNPAHWKGFLEALSAQQLQAGCKCCRLVLPRGSVSARLPVLQHPFTTRALDLAGKAWKRVLTSQI